MTLPWMIAAALAAAASAASALNEEKSPQEAEKDKERRSSPVTPVVDEDATEGLMLESFVELGRRIETARVLQRMTQEKCANVANVSRTALRNLEDGKDARLSTLLAVSNALAMPVTTLFKGLQPELEKNLSQMMDS